jgi:hypothetical protein
VSTRPSRKYDPSTFKALTFHDAAARFRDGVDTPRAYLERCLATIDEREPVVKAFAALNETGAREAADASALRWKAGRPLSLIDGMPVGIKDLLETKDMPTQMGCEAYRGNFPKRDNAAVWALRQAGAVILGKTATAELGGAHPPATTNPFDPARTAGGSSSGSAAAVAARMIPAAHRHAGRRLHHPPRSFLRQRRAEADAGRHQPRRAPGDQHEYARRARRMHRGYVAGRCRNRRARRWRSRLLRTSSVRAMPRQP